jgi:hypothetical protein
VVKGILGVLPAAFVWAFDLSGHLLGCHLLGISSSHSHFTSSHLTSVHSELDHKLMASNSGSPPVSDKDTETSLQHSQSAQAPPPLIINGIAVPTGPRAERLAMADDPFVTPPRGIEVGTPVGVRGASTACVSRAEVNVTPTPTGFTPRPDRLAETVSADNAQGVYPPQACVFVAK